MTKLAMRKLADKINQEHEACEGAFTESLGHARRAGELLIEAKGQVEHGDWLPWVEANCEFSVRTAQVYMRIESNWAELANTQGLAHLGVESAAKLLADPRETEPEPIRILPPDDDPLGTLNYCHWQSEHLKPQMEELIATYEEIEARYGLTEVGIPPGTLEGLTEEESLDGFRAVIEIAMAAGGLSNAYRRNWIRGERALAQVYERYSGRWGDTNPEFIEAASKAHAKHGILAKLDADLLNEYFDQFQDPPEPNNELTMLGAMQLARDWARYPDNLQHATKLRNLGKAAQ